MAYREFVDRCRIPWAVWSVAPTRSERRARDTRRSAERAKRDRRHRSAAPTVRLRVSAPLSAGWLCFESAAEKRRLVPVPPGWQQMSDRGLEELCARATVVAKTALEWVRPTTARLGVTASTPSGAHPRTRFATLP
jgi:hypothetical protein